MSVFDLNVQKAQYVDQIICLVATFILNRVNVPGQFDYTNWHITESYDVNMKLINLLVNKIKN